MPRPLAVRRHNEILRRLHAAGSVTVAELAETFIVSHETIRRDLKLLSEKGHLDIVHGGAASRGISESTLLHHAANADDGRCAIGRTAAAMVNDGATVLLDAGGTTAAVARELIGRTGLTVCTNSLSHALLFCRVPGTRVFVLGGEVDGECEAIDGADAIAAIGSLRVDIAFVGVGGFAEDGGATVDTRDRAELKGRMILSGPCYMVAEHGRFGMRGPFRVPNLERAAGIIVDQTPDDALVNAWAGSGLNMILAR